MLEETSIKILFLNNVESTGRKAGIFPDEVRSVGPDLYPLEGRAREVHILGRWLLWKLLKDRGALNAFDAISFSPFGKPYIPGGLSFNISHSKDLIVCAAATHGEIGIDVEHGCPLDWQGYEDSFAPSEWTKISSAGNPSAALLERWTKKESLVKADGRGLQIPFAAVTLYDHYGTIGNEQKRWYIRPVSFDGYFCHVSTEFPVSKILLEEVSIFPHA